MQILEPMQTWQFNSLFEKYSMEDAVKRACEMERQRIALFQLPLLNEIYAPGWNDWENMPAAQLVQDIMDWDDANVREHRDDPTFPNYFNCPIVWKGEMSPELLREIQLGQFASLTNGVSVSAFSGAKAYIDGHRDLFELVTFWTFDEQTHEKMKAYSLEKRYGVAESTLFEEADELLVELRNSQIKQITSDNIRAVNKFSALRDGPALLAGASMLSERFNPRNNQMSREPMMKHYGYDNDQLVFVNVHCYIDIFHAKLGQYLIAKYAKAKEDQQIVKNFYIGQREKQRKNTKEFFDRLGTRKAGEKLKLPSVVVDIKAAKAGIDVDTA